MEFYKCDICGKEIDVYEYCGGRVVSDFWIAKLGAEHICNSCDWDIEKIRAKQRKVYAIQEAQWKWELNRLKNKQ